MRTFPIFSDGGEGGRGGRLEGGGGGGLVNSVGGRVGERRGSTVFSRTSVHSGQCLGHCAVSGRMETGTWRWSHDPGLDQD